ncbi:MAG TPA: TonB-dependent receptor plug domain-containing protein, partial [Chitinispirillaceae bacterium]|nr:TonB-dependent receptor plug domain-containing protein [Chitinispirillaceae bacterium]
MKNAQTGKPLSGVMVEIEGSDISTLTDSTGFFRFESVPSGSFNLLFFHEKSEPLSITDIFVPGNGEKRIEAEMNPVIANLEKMVVTGHAFRRAPDMSSSTKMMSFDEILRSPGALVDVQRAVQDLPSVSSAADNTNEIIVRGGNPGENLLIMDNIEIPNPNHFADQGSGGGVISLINPLLVKGLTFNAGAPPAQYGGKASSVLDVKLREGNDKIVLGGVDLGMAGVGFHAEGPLWSGANFMASATKSYLNLFSNFADATAIPRYWGLQGKVAQNIGSQKLYANFIYGDNGIEIADASGQIGTDGDEIEAGGKVYAAGVSWEGNWGEKFSTLVTLSGTGNSFERLEYSINPDDTRDTFFTNTSMEQEQTIKVQGSLDLPRNTRIM